MKIEANDKEVQDVLGLGYFKIPRFQRAYSWSSDEVSNFWDDVVVQEHENYFIGSMVVFELNKPYFGIVDGQQRLTTITLMLAALRNAFLDLNEESLAQGVQNFIERANIENVRENILDTETSYPFFHSHIQSFRGENIDCPIGSEEQNLKAAFDLIVSKLRERVPGQTIENGQMEMWRREKEMALLTLKKIRDTVLTLKLVLIQLDNEEDAYLIFETLNTRGRDLTPADLVKNLLLNKLKAGNISIDTAKEKWNTILEKFDDSGIDNGVPTFLLHFWLSKYGHTTSTKLFSEVSRKVLSESDAQRLLDEFQSDANYYIELMRPRNVEWKLDEREIRESLAALQQFKVRQQTPFVLSLLRRYREGGIRLPVFRKALRRIEDFHYVFNAITSQRSSGSIATLYSRHAIELDLCASYREVQDVLGRLVQELARWLPDFPEFESAFEGLSLSKNKNLVKYTLAKLMGETSHGLAVDFGAMTVEHLLPKCKDNDFSLDVIDSIGNLILVDKETNNIGLGDKDFAEKLELLKSISYDLDSELVAAKKWDIQEIKKRTSAMARRMYERVVGSLER